MAVTTIHVQLDDQTYAKAREAAEATGRTIEELAAEAIAEKAAAGSFAPKVGASIIGMWADEPEAVEDMLKTVMEMRRERNEGLFRRIDEFVDESNRP